MLPPLIFLGMEKLHAVGKGIKKPKYPDSTVGLHIRKTNRRIWRQVKSSGSEALMKLIAASAPGEAIQEANLLYDSVKTRTRARNKNTPREDRNNFKDNLYKKGCMKQCSKQHTYLIRCWTKQQEKCKQRQQERKIKRDIALRKKNHSLQLGRSQPTKEKENTIDDSINAPNKMCYAQTLVVATLNCRGLMEAGKREQLMYIMHKHKIDLVALQETKVSSNSEEIKTLPGTNDKYIFRFNSKANSTQQQQRQPHAKAAAHKAAAKSGRASRLVEHHGVGFVIGPYIAKAVKDCTPYTSRLMELVLHNHGPDIHIINHYAPHSGRTQEEKTHHWDMLQDLVLNKPQNLPIYVLGDSNARLHGYTSDLE